MRIAATMTLAAMLGCSLMATSLASAATHSSDSKATSLKSCNKQADEKKLNGSERTTFVKDCRAGKMH
jgi:hypothetical protein